MNNDNVDYFDIETIFGEYQIFLIGEVCERLLVLAFAINDLKLPYFVAELDRKVRQR